MTVQGARQTAGGRSLLSHSSLYLLLGKGALEMGWSAVTGKKSKTFKNISFLCRLSLLNTFILR